jgi:Holliday junction resolvasome RuvABC DNA-binding subunit
VPDSSVSGGGGASIPAMAPTDENIEALVNLGFTREQASTALVNYGNNVDRAAASLLNLT